MATNKKKIFVTESMSNQGRALLHARDDIELVEFPNMISAKDFEAKLKEHAPVHGVALGGTGQWGYKNDYIPKRSDSFRHHVGHMENESKQRARAGAQYMRQHHLSLF